MLVLQRVGVVGGAEGGDLERLGALHHMHDLEAAADDARAAEQAAHLIGRGVGGDVVVLGLDAGDQVAHRAADDVGLEAALLQRFADAPGAGRDLLAADAVAAGRDGLGLACGAGSPRRKTRRSSLRIMRMGDVLGKGRQ